MFRGSAMPLGLSANPKPEGTPNYGESQSSPENEKQHLNRF